ncbi:MAG: GyrI-like domain-containing protein [Micromonosporaceae bacterium]
MRYEVLSRHLSEQPVAVIKGRLPVEQASQWLPLAYREIFDHVRRQGVAIVGPPYARYLMGPEQPEMEAGAPVARPVRDAGRVRSSLLPAGPAAVTVHVGPYEGLREAVRAVSLWVREHGAEPAGAHWEVYYSDPEQEPDPNRWRTEVVQPYRVEARVPG